MFHGRFSIVIGEVHNRRKLIFINDKLISVSMCYNKETAIIWACLVGSKSQAKDLNYKIEVRIPESKFIYEGPVRYIDEKTEDIFKSKMFLTVPIGLQGENNGNKLLWTIEIKNLKSNIQINNLLTESENSEIKEPMLKKIKLENTD